MRIIKCYVENFGLLKEYSCYFDGGLSCFYSDNGTGKTTLSVFIMSMLYGIGDTRRISISENERKKYYPWQGGKFGGSLTIEAGGKRYIIERSFGLRAADDSFHLLDLDTGSVSNDFSENIGEELFGIDKDGFLRTVFLSEKNLSGKNENKSISAKLSDLVGADGDVGGFDSAIDILESRRKFYYKKGGSGEIADVKAKLYEKERKLEYLIDKKREADEKQAKLTALAAEIAETEEKRRLAESKIAKISQNAEKRASFEQYQAICAELEKEKEELSSLSVFFAAGVPSLYDTDRAKEDLAEGIRLISEAQASRQSDEQKKVNQFFASGINPEMMREAEEADASLKECEAELNRITKKDSEASHGEIRISDKSMPDPEKLNKLSLSLEKTKGKGIVAVIFGAILVFASVLLGITVHASLLCIIAIGILAAGYGTVKLMQWISAKRRAIEYAASLGVYGKNAYSALLRLENRLKDYKLLAAENERRKDELISIKDELTEKLLSFLSRFPMSDDEKSDIHSCVTHARDMYVIYRHTEAVLEHSRDDSLDKLQKGRGLIDSANNFLAKYPTTSDKPFDQIRDKTNEYSYKQANLKRLMSQLSLLEEKYNFGSDNYTACRENEENVLLSLSEFDARLTGLRREYALLDREYRQDIEICGERDEVIIAKDYYKEKLSRYTKNLSVIQKTKALLTEACDSLTARYIGKTKESFISYERAIGGLGGEFALDTDFSLTKNERGSARTEESFSRGTRDLYALALRLALIDSLYDKEMPFIILDDPFVAFDDGKRSRAMELIRRLAADRQIIYFTCAKSRAF